jgi:hypothetical protein
MTCDGTRRPFVGVGWTLILIKGALWHSLVNGMTVTEGSLANGAAWMIKAGLGLP